MEVLIKESIINQNVSSQFIKHGPEPVDTSTYNGTLLT